MSELPVQDQHATYTYRYSWIVLVIGVAFVIMETNGHSQFYGVARLLIYTSVGVFLGFIYLYWKTYVIEVGLNDIAFGPSFQRRTFLLADVSLVQVLTRYKSGPFVRVVGGGRVLLEVDGALRNFESFVARLDLLAQSHGIRFERGRSTPHKRGAGPASQDGA